MTCNPRGSPNPRSCFHFRIDGCLRDYYQLRAQIRRRRDFHFDIAPTTKSVSGFVASITHFDTALREFLPKL
jgi:hypothetical protein